MLGLDRGGSCRGIAYRLPSGEAPARHRPLWAREMTGGVYRMRAAAAWRPREARAALCLHGAPRLRDYAGRLSFDETARLIAQGGRRPRAGRDYLANTVRHLEELGIADGPLHRIEEKVDGLAERRGSP